MVFFDVVAYSGDRYRNYIEKAWINPRSGQTEIGIRKSPKGEIFAPMGSLPELHRYLRNDPEVYQCLTRRIAGYFLDKDQAISQKWLDPMAASLFQNRAQSSVALDQLITRILASETFAELEYRDPNRCYDGVSQTTNSSYCAVEGIVQSHCARCHSGMSPDGGLNMDSWRPDLGFVHVQDDGKPIGKTESLRLIKSRLSHSDPSLLMPQGSFLPDPLRQRLSGWIDAEIN